MNFLHDTDVASYIFAGRAEAPPFREKLIGQASFKSFVTVAEMKRGALSRKWSPRRIAELAQYLTETYPVCPIRVTSPMSGRRS